ncbi:MAG: signal recognition particle protein [Acidimicrobiia bacterium]
MFDTLTDRFTTVFGRLTGKGRLSEADVDTALREVRLALLEADVNVSVVRDLMDRIRARAIGAEVHESLTPGQQVVKIVDEELVTTLGREHVPLAKPSSPPLVILMAGLQGSGKTTTSAKLARHLKEQESRRPMLVAADLQRPAAIDQLIQLGERIDVPVYSDRTSRPTRVVKAALKEAARGGHDVVIIDTAGRLQVDDDLMAELAAIRKVAAPDETLLVVDAMTGQDAVNVAQGFLEHTDLTGIVLSKLDGDARGGAAISVREVTGRPIKFAAVGEGLEDFEVFHPDRMASRILGMGDVLTLIEKAEQVWEEEEAERLAERMQQAEFDLEDFLSQMQQVRRMGDLQGLLSMMPGAGALRDVEIDERDLARVEAIIRSMTPEERRTPKIINASRRKRIARGSGTSLQQVNRLLKQFADARKMMQALATGGMPAGMPGMPGMPGGLPGGRPPQPRKATKPPRNKKKKRKKR